LQAVFASIYDYYLLKLTTLSFGKQYKFLVFAINYLNWFSLYVMIRTVVNSYEATLFIVALYNWKLSKTLSDPYLMKKFKVFGSLFKVFLGMR